VARLASVLKDAGVAREYRGRLALTRADVDPDEISLERDERRHAYDASRLEMMRAYAETDDCRRRLILNYLGEEFDPAGCGGCDVHDREGEVDLLSGAATPLEDAVPEGPYRLGDRVSHRTFGPGLGAARHGRRRDGVLRGGRATRPWRSTSSSGATCSSPVDAT
jgi:ATP-dependent DNA helicase RecQ